MSVVRFYLRCTFLIISFLSQPINSQINWNIYTEGGYFKSINSKLSQPHELLFRMDGNFNYLYAENDVSTAVKLNARPEIYGFNNNFKSLKLKASGNYSKVNKTMNWGLNLTGQRNFYKNNITDFTYNIFFLTLNSDWYEFDNYPMSAQFGYSYQTASENIEQNLDLLFFSVKISKTFFPNSNSRLGIYIERFKIDNKYLSRLTNSARDNRGWRFGPQISFEYLERGIITLDYRFLFHSSQVTKQPSYENWIRLIAGMIFSENWSIFLLTDFYDRQFTLKKENSVEEYFLYNPLDAENKMNIKLARELDAGIEAYIKAGYFKEKFFDDSFNFEGWNILFGIEIGN